MYNALEQYGLSCRHGYDTWWARLSYGQRGAPPLQDTYTFGGHTWGVVDYRCPTVGEYYLTAPHQRVQVCVAGDFAQPVLILARVDLRPRKPRRVGHKPRRKTLPKTVQY